MSTLILSLALQAIDDPSALPVLGDAVLEWGWFDARVCRLLYPMGAYPRRKLSKKEQAERRRTRAAWMDGMPLAFQMHLAKPTASFARAVAAVLLFGEWKRRPWPLCRPGLRLYRDVYVTINGVQLEELTDAVITAGRRWASQPSPREAFARQLTGEDDEP